MEESAGARSLWNLWGRICHCLFLGSGGWLPAVLGTWLADTLLRSLPLSSQAFLLPVCLCPDFLPFIKMPVTGLCACVLCVCSVAQSCLTLCSPMDCKALFRCARPSGGPHCWDRVAGLLGPPG